jgi:hypothetical protein
LAFRLLSPFSYHEAVNDIDCVLAATLFSTLRSWRASIRLFDCLRADPLTNKATLRDHNDKMRQSLSSLQKVKTGIHVVQALAIFIATCITIAVFVQKGKTDGRTKWFFAVVRLD